MLVAGRRFGKTYLSVPELIRMANGPGREAWYVAPTYKQAKMIAWLQLKRQAAPYIVAKNETELSVELRSGGRIRLHGAENYDSLRGPGLDGLVVDEFADIAKEAWSEVLRPMLSDRLGCALFIGTPEGYNHFYEMWNEAHGKPDWAAFQFTTLQGGNVTAEEIEAARGDLDAKTFRQEYEASFENFVGRAYYAFERADNVKPLVFDPTRPLIWTMDFNVNPMASVICQIVGDSARPTVHVLEEIILPNSNTVASCEVFYARAQKYRDAMRGHPLMVRVYGDPAGAQRRSSASKSDWAIVRDAFSGWHNLPMRDMVASSAPLVKDRINAVNGMLCNAHSERRLIVDPSCAELIADLEQVAWKTDAAGNAISDLDKSNLKRTHVSDALGYLIAKEFKLTTHGGPRGGLLV
jgi:hypothetical protein